MALRAILSSAFGPPLLQGAAHLTAWLLISWNFALSPCPLPVEGGPPLLPLPAFLKLAALYGLCAAPPLRTTHYALRTIFPGHRLLATGYCFLFHQLLQHGAQFVHFILFSFTDVFGYAAFDMGSQQEFIETI